MKIQMTDLGANYNSVKSEIDMAVQTVCCNSNFILGKEVSEFEKSMALFLGVKYAIGVANGTDALRIALMACGVTKGDEVITTPFTFIATTEAIIDCGAKPVFVDIEPEAWNIDADKIESKINKKTKAILPVHLYGLPCDIDKIVELAKKYNLVLIEDCAQSFTAKYTLKNGETRQTGSFGDAGCFSFFPAKNLGCFGDGGMISTNSDEVFEKAKMLRNHGSKVRYFHDIHGFNSRLDTLQAAILLVKLKYIQKWTDMRNRVAAKYNSALKDYAQVPQIRSNVFHSFNYYNIVLKNKKIRDGLMQHLAANEIASTIYYPVSLHLQKCYNALGYKSGDFPIAEYTQDKILALPMYPEISDEQVNYICRNLVEYLKNTK